MVSRWVECLDAAKLADIGRPHPNVQLYEQVRLIAVSQGTAGMWLDIVVDGGWDTFISSGDFRRAAQRRLGLHLSGAKAAFDALERRGVAVDRTGNALCNGGEYNRRHNAVMMAVHKMISAVATGPVVLGDKADPSLTDDFNADHIVDVAEVGGGGGGGGFSAPGDDAGTTLVEIKCSNPAIQDPKSNGHKTTAGARHAFGNTIEGTQGEPKILGCPERGRPTDAPFDAKTGKGRVDRIKGDYDDAILNKRLKVVPWLTECFGGVTPKAARYARLLARRTQGKHATDRTRYGNARSSPKAFYTHHMQQVSKAAVITDAAAIGKQITSLNQKAFGHGATRPAVAGRA